MGCTSRTSVGKTSMGTIMCAICAGLAQWTQKSFPNALQSRQNLLQRFARMFALCPDYAQLPVRRQEWVFGSARLKYQLFNGTLLYFIWKFGALWLLNVVIPDTTLEHFKDCFT
ncbi:unnamed protein product [Prorocentrum cordatum]|uniref:Uncharacterized protein n=1 Tax=Prorocentrum cordatum TaxID=2364126 RepID=A0ABN9S6W1_9DINO|nr:unnamed protein product [Polarella glacialis]